MNEAGAPGVAPFSSAIVTGATNQIGRYLIPGLLSAGQSVVAVSRSEQTADRGGIRWFTADLKDSLDWPSFEGRRALFHLAHLSLLPSHIEALADVNVGRIVAFSSTSRFSKVASGSFAERALANGLVRSEERFISKCEAAAISWTLFRPTMIYGRGIDRNVSFVARTAKSCRFFPLAGNGTGLRQPVHAEDLAGACMGVLNNPRTHGKVYTLSGGEVLSYRELVERVFLGLNLTPRIVVVPVFALRAAIRLIRLIPRFRYLTPEMANRMNVDLCFDHSEASGDFDFSPRERFVYEEG